MKKITTSVAGAAAAAAVAAVAAYATLDREPAATAGTGDDAPPAAVEIPRVSPPAVEVPVVGAANAESFSGSGLGIPVVEPVSVADAAADLPDTIALHKTLLPVIRDKRTLLGAAPEPGDPVWQRWLAIYADAGYRDYVPEYRPLAPGLRIINEVRCPATPEESAVLRERLDYYAARGYNAVLVTFDTTENLSRLCVTVDGIRRAGFQIVIAYAGRENLEEPVFRDPEVLRRFLTELGSRADALLLGWRRTSVHLFLPDRPFTNFLIRSAREGNPDLPFVGMAYYGETAETPRGITYDVPENCSAVLVVGLGFPRASTRTALRTLFPEVAGHPHLIGLAVGEKPYFDTLHATGRSQAENDAIKRRIEIRLLQAGCKSTMTYSGDGSDGGYDNEKTENLCRRYGWEK